MSIPPSSPNFPSGHCPKRPARPKSKGCFTFIATDESGSLTLMGALTLGALASYLFFQLLYARNSLEIMQERSDTYICYRQVTTYTKLYVEIMAGANLTIDAALAAAALSLGTLTPQAAQVIQNMIRLQNLTHVWFVQKLSFSSFCSVTQKAFLLKNLPYQTVGALKLKRPYLNVITKRNKWHVYLPSNPKRLTSDPMSAFALKIEFRLAGFFDPLLGFEAKEISAGQFLKLN